MPSPLAHTAIGASIALLWPAAGENPTAPTADGRIKWPSRKLIAAALLAANAPDLDYLPGLAIGNWNAFHAGPTHSFAFVAFVAIGLSALFFPLSQFRAVVPLLLAAGISHLMADMATEDLRPPYGIPLLWPFYDAHWKAPVDVFWHLKKRSWSDIWQWHNLLALGVEAALVLPLTALTCAVKLRPRVLRLFQASSPKTPHPCDLRS